MKISFKETILEKIDLLDNIANMRKSEINELVNNLKDSIISIFLNNYELQSITPTRNILFGNVKQDYGVSFGLNRLKDRLIIANWLLDMQPKTRNYLLTFFLVKESLLHFFSNDINEANEANEAIINIITILFLVELFKITTIDNPILSAIRSKIYSEEIAELSLYYWDNLLFLLIRNNVPFSDILNMYKEIIDGKSNTSIDTAKLFSDWTFSKTLKEGDSILPFYTNLKHIELIKLLDELGHEKGTTSNIAKRLNLTQKTITKWFKALNDSYSTFWRADINYEKINLHNYLFKIILKKNDSSKKLNQILLEIPYLKSLFQGTDSNLDILYSPSLVCPHIISEQLSDRLSKMKNRGMIEDYFVQLVRERSRNFALTNYPFDSKISSFKKLIASEDLSLKKFTFYHYKRSSIIPTRDKPVNLDYNMLYFLSVINSKFLLKSRYGVSVNEFKKFYLKNDIPITDVDAQTNLLYQNELRAKNKGLLSFSLYMRNRMKRSPDVLIFEIPATNGLLDKEFKEIIRKLQVFAMIGHNTLYDRYIFNLPGVAHTHPVKDVIQEFLEGEGLTSSFYTIKLFKANFVPLQNLFDYEDQKWKITDFKE